MRTIRNSFGNWAIIGGLIASFYFDHAQAATITVQSASADSIVQIAAESQSLVQVAPADLPLIGGTFWWVMPGGDAVPAPCPPLDWTGAIYQIADGQFLVDETGGQAVANTPRFGMQAQATSSIVASQADAVLNLITQIQTAEVNQPMRTMARAMGMDVPFPGGDDSGDGDGSSPMFNSALAIDTNVLWLEITNVSNGLAYINLNSATDSVYEILSKTDLTLTNWNIEQEVWPTDTNCMLFTVPQLGRTNLFIWAQDWTGVAENGNTTPDWWFWKYFGTVALSDTNLDSQGNTLLYDYQNELDPNIIDFLVSVTNQYVNVNLVPMQLNVIGGVPSYEAILVNDTDMADAVWQPYTGSNVVATLGEDGNYKVSVGLRGLPSDATETWQSVALIKNTVSPTLTITNPTTSIVSQSTIQLQGYANEPLISLSFDVSNATGIFTNQQGYLTGQFYDTYLFAYTTNYFQCPDIGLGNGTNIITLHATDWAGNKTDASFTLDYSPSPAPTLMVIWPQDGTYVSGSQFIFEGTVDEPGVTITASIVDANGGTNFVQGLVEQNGTVWVQNMPMAAGTNTVTVTAVNATGNQTITNLILIQSSVTVTMDTLSSDQFNQSSVTVTGTISDPSETVTVNGMPAYYVDGGSWEADGVPVSAIGTATFDVEVYSGNTPASIHTNLRFSPMDNSSAGSNIGSQMFSQPQPVAVGLKSYSGIRHQNSVGFVGCGLNYASYSVMKDSIGWSFDSGGIENTLISGQTAPADPTEDGSRTFTFTIPAGVNAITPPWEYAYLTTFPHISVGCIDQNITWENHTETRVMIEPQGQLAAGTTNLYLVQANASEFSSPPYGNTFGALISGAPSWYVGDVPLPPEWLQINGQTLINSGITNNDGSVSGMTLVTAPAGVNWDVTPVATQVHVNWDYTFYVQAFDITPRILVDNSRSGNVNSLTTSNSPYCFWINDSQEHGDDESSGGADDQIPGRSYFNANYSLTHVNGSSDLVNFFPVALNLNNALQLLPPSSGWEYHLTQNDAGLPAGMGNGAVKFVYTSLSPTNAFEYLTNTAGFGYGTNSDEWATNADTIQVLNTPGTVLDTNWLAQVQNNGGYGVILVEGCAAATQPLMLEIWHNGQKMGSVPMYLSISGVEQMFRHVNFSYVNGTVEVPARSDAPNEPQTNGKNLVFLHGYNVNQPEARGVESEMFKRFYWSGSKAKFYGVTWNGAESKQDAAIQALPQNDRFTPNFHTNVVNALQTAPHLADFLNGLSGETTVAAHSLGNMVVLSAISDYNVTAIKHYFMIDSAVPIEAVQGDAATEPAMVYSTWQQYSNWLYASDWWQLFTNDYRSTLTWSNRFGNLGSVDIYNFYSSGEEVLREDTEDPPSTIIGSGVQEAINAISFWGGAGLPYGTYAWVWQEKGKGTDTSDSFIGSMHGGWSFNLSYYTYYEDGAPPTRMSASDAALLPNSELQTNAFFDFTSEYNGYGIDTADLALYGSSGSTYAAANRDRILSDAIPALTLPVGANHVDKFAPDGEPDQNVNMQTSFENGWPTRSGDEAGKWHHSDFDYVAYPFTYQLFNKIVTLGNLK